MYLWLLSNPDITHEVVVGRGLRAEAMSRASYAAMTRLEDLVRHVARVAAGSAGGAWRALARWHRRRRAMAELGALNDRALKDIGVSRGEIYARVEEVLEAEARRREIAADVRPLPIDRGRDRPRRTAEGRHDRPRRAPQTDRRRAA